MKISFIVISKTSQITQNIILKNENWIVNNNV